MPALGSRALIVLALTSVFLAESCASPEVLELEHRQREVQDCILSGGHPSLGPGDTILCL